MSNSGNSLVGRLIGLTLVTVFAVAVMLATGTNWWTPGGGDEPVVPPGASRAGQQAAAVVVRRLEPEQIEILDTYSGMIRPFERFTLAFEMDGRLKSFGQSAEGKPLDEGDRVRAGQALAELDQRIFLARKQETTARLEQAQYELAKAKELLQRNVAGITEREFQQRVTELEVAQAQAAMAQKNLEDATLVCPCDGVISRRYRNAGESINAHQSVFEVVQVDDVLLVVGVPESRVRELQLRRRAIEQQRNELSRAGELGQVAFADQDDASLRFHVHVQLMGTDRYGRPWPQLEGEVSQISETADDRTGLFEVEVLIANRDGMLKPGLVALARIVIERIEGFRVPVQAALFRDGQGTLFSVVSRQSDVRFLYWSVGSGQEYTARRWPLTTWIEQDGELIIPELDEELRTLVVRGQHRLVNGRRVKVVAVGDDDSSAPAAVSAEPPVPALGAKP